MLDVFLKHFIYEKSIEVLFQQLEQNFVLPNIIDPKVMQLIVDSLPDHYTLRHAYVEKDTGNLILQLDMKTDYISKFNINLDLKRYDAKDILKTYGC